MIPVVNTGPTIISIDLNKMEGGARKNLDVNID